MLAESRVETVVVCVECIPRTRQALRGPEKKVAPEFCVEDCQSLALFVQAQLEIPAGKVHTCNESCVMPNSLLYLIGAGKGMDGSRYIFVERGEIDDQAQFLRLLGYKSCRSTYLGGRIRA